MPLPADHPLRHEANLEMHARPSDPLVAPLSISYLALMSDPARHDREWLELCDLIQRHGMTAPARPANHYSGDLGPFHLRWERHTEFVRYTFVRSGEQAFSPPALAAVPNEWIESLSGQTIMATHAALLPTDADALDYDQLANTYFQGNVLVGGAIAEGAAVALTDFKIHADGHGRLLVLDHGMSARQAGRMMQRLLELDTYRIMALLALPLARQLGPFLSKCERELAKVSTALSAASDEDETGLLERLTRLEADISGRESSSEYRFGAAAAYHELVKRRIGELQERRIQGLQTFNEFIERRLAPAMNTCGAVAARLRSLSERVSRANQLLSTRVDITRQRQNQALLEALNRRGEMQLKLQQTVEGLSVAAITYYIVGLISYAAKGLTSLGMPMHSDTVVLISMPLVAIGVTLAINRIHKRVIHTDGREHRR